LIFVQPLSVRGQQAGLSAQVPDPALDNGRSGDRGSFGAQDARPEADRQDAGTGGVAELKAQIKEEEEASGFVPDLVIIDWLGEMVMRYNGLGDSDAAYRRCCEKFMSELVQFKEDHGCAILVLHQTNTKAQGLSATTPPNKTMAHEFRSFANKCDSCSVLGVMDRVSRVCWFIPDKSRRSASEDRKIRLNGKYMRFEDVSSTYTAYGPSFIKVTELEERERLAAAGRSNDGDY